MLPRCGTVLPFIVQRSVEKKKQKGFAQKSRLRFVEFWSRLIYGFKMMTGNLLPVIILKPFFLYLLASIAVVWSSLCSPISALE
jgi:hypothetical protein